MSYDLDIATRRRPASLMRILDDLRLAAKLEGAFQPGRNVLVTKFGKTNRTIDVEGPVRVEREDLDGTLAAAVPNARWLAGIHLPGGFAEPDDRWALDLAIALAREFEGAVWDPQLDRVVWPEAQFGTSAPATAYSRASIQHPEPSQRLVLRWHVPTLRLTQGAAAGWLAFLRGRLPEALPTRFGITEPYQHRLERDGEDAFGSDWAAVSGARYGLLTWNGATKRWSGSAFFRPGAGRLAPIAELTVTVDDDALISDEAAADRLADALAAAADAFDAVYAEAHLERVAVELSPTGGVISPFRTVRAEGWAGFPWDPTWLAWFGRPYAARLEPILRDRIDPSGERGFFVRTGSLPAPREELRALAPRIPAELVQHERVVEVEGVASPVARLEPAVEIPRLDDA